MRSSDSPSRRGGSTGQVSRTRVLPATSPPFEPPILRTRPHDDTRAVRVMCQHSQTFLKYGVLDFRILSPRTDCARQALGAYGMRQNAQHPNHIYIHTCYTQ